MHQLTIAIPLPPIVKKQMERLSYGLPNTDWIESHDLHLSLLSLSKIDGSVMLDIQEKINDFKYSTFSIAVNGIECTNPRARGMAYAGVTQTQELNNLIKLIETRLKEIPLAPDHPKLKPYILLGNFERIEAKNISFYLEANSSFTTSPFKVDSLVLIERQTTGKQHQIFIEQSRHYFKKNL